MGNRYIVVSGITFGFIAAAHLVRAIGNVPVHLGSSELPVWASWVAAGASGALCLWAFRSRS
jgi:hypothetical protein